MDADRDAAGSVSPDAADLREYRRLRRHYQRTRRNGRSDESFLNWCEAMAAWERHYGPKDITEATHA